MAELGILRMEGERNENLKPVGLILQVAEAKQVIDAVVGIFNMSVEHGAIGAQTDLVSGAMDLEPSEGIGFVLANLIANFGMEDLSSSSGHASETGIFEVFENPLKRFLGLKTKPIDFYRSPCLQVDLREMLMQ